MNVAWSRLEKLEKAVPLAAVLAPIALALALILARGHVNDADLAMILMVAVVALALTGRRLPERIAAGEEADYVVTSVAGELRELLRLRDCEFTRSLLAQKV